MNTNDKQIKQNLNFIDELVAYAMIQLKRKNLWEFEKSEYKMNIAFLKDLKEKMIKGYLERKTEK